MTGPQLLGGTWNMERDRPPVVAALSAITLMRTQRLDFLCVQECAHYLEQLRAQGGDEYRVIAFTSSPGRSESAILVRRDAEHGPGYQVRATRSGWFTVRGGKTPPKYLTTVKIGGLRIVSGHTAPSVKWRSGRILGPIRRVASMRQFARAVRRFASRHAGPLLIAGDWNATPATRGRWSPHWIAQKAGLRIAAPARGTHGSRIIDFALYRGCAVKATLGARRGSDHHAVIFKVTP